MFFDIPQKSLFLGIMPGMCVHVFVLASPQDLTCVRFVLCVDDTIVRNDNGGKNAISVDVKLVPITVTVSALLSMGEHGRFGEKAHDAESGVVVGGYVVPISRKAYKGVTEWAWIPRYW